MPISNFIDYKFRRTEVGFGANPSISATFAFYRGHYEIIPNWEGVPTLTYLRDALLDVGDVSIRSTSLSDLIRNLNQKAADKVARMPGYQVIPEERNRIV